MKNYKLDIYGINTIIKKTIQEIDYSKDQVIQIVDNVKSEEQNLAQQLNSLKRDIKKVIEEADELEKQDKIMRQKLAYVSKNFNQYSEEEIKTVYDEASEVRIKYFTKVNEEKTLREKRTSLERALKKTSENIENAEKIVYQISIALGYLNGGVLASLEDTDRSSEMFLGIKILEAQENERKRIARDIHDGPAQHMANAIMKADICKKVFEVSLEDGFDELQGLKESVRVALKEVRSIIFDLRPMSLDDLGLNQTIEENVKSFTQETDIDIELKLKPIKKEIEPIIQVAVYRIIQEIFNNIKKHSKAKHVEVKSDFGTKYMMIIITDDGVGFNVDETLKRVKTKGSSYGLISIMDRVQQLQGEIDIKSSEGNGTVYRIKLPINREVIKDEKNGD